MQKLNLFKVAFSSLLHHWKLNLTVVLGTALAAAILTGALAAGDSVRHSLESHVHRRLGKTAYVFESGNRLMQTGLADRIKAVPVLRIKGIAVKDGGQARANNIQVLGIDKRFWSLSEKPVSFAHPGAGEGVINRPLADRLGVSVGDEILLKTAPPSLLPSEMPLLREDRQSLNIRLVITALAGEEELGGFSTQANQATPLTLFLPLSALGNRINLLLVPAQNGQDAESIQKLIDTNLTLPDTGLRFAASPQSQYLTLFSERIFIDDKLGTIARTADSSATARLTYFANSIRNGRLSTPYSFVTGTDSPLDGITPGYNEIIISDWIANDLNAAPGDTLILRYFTQRPGETLKEAEATFTVKAVIKLAGLEEERTLVPAFPGLTEEDNCRDWKPGIPLDFTRIRTRDEEYWNRYKATPKAFINLGRAQELWANRFGNLTCIRWPYTEERAALLPGKIMKTSDAAAYGITFSPVLAEGLEASRRGINFGSLFLGLSVFLIGAALLLAGLFFQFSTEHSSPEIGLLLALGFSQTRVQWLLFCRGLILAATGALAGILPGILYNQIVLAGLLTVWNNAIGTTYLTAHIRLETIATGFVLVTLAGGLVLWAVIHKTTRKPVTALLRSTGQYEQLPDKDKAPVSLIITIASLAGLLILILISVLSPPHEPAGLFFTAGSLALTASLSACHLFLLHRNRKPNTHTGLNLSGLGFRNLVRKRKRTLLTIGLIAGSIFAIVSVGANKKGLPADLYAHNAPTGGYRFFIETSLPLPSVPLNMDPDTEFLPLRVQPGDDASCLNLNYVSQPRLLGLDPRIPAGRDSFSFSGKPLIPTTDQPWLLLDQSPTQDLVYGFIDQTVLTWNLGKSLGDTISYTDEQGREFKVKLIAALADTLFQGSILISEKAFLSKYPTHNGYQLLLADTIPGKSMLLETALRQNLQILGADIQSAGERIAAFNQVENTYLIIYLMLGGLGLVIGVAGFAIVVLRKITEMKSTLALLKAMGFAFHSLILYILAENWPILMTGLICGSIASTIALIPVFITDSSQVPVGFLLLIIVGMLINGIGWLLITTIAALRGNLISGLRRE